MRSFLKTEWVLPLMRKLYALYENGAEGAKLTNYLSGIAVKLHFSEKVSALYYLHALPLGLGMLAATNLYPEVFVETLHTPRFPRQRRSTDNSELVRVAKLASKRVPGKRSSTTFFELDISPSLEPTLRDSDYGARIEQEIVSIKRMIQELERKHSKKKASITELLRRNRPFPH